MKYIVNLGLRGGGGGAAPSKSATGCLFVVLFVTTVASGVCVLFVFCRILVVYIWVKYFVIFRNKFST